MPETVTVACDLPNGLTLDFNDADGNRVAFKLRGTAEARQRDSDGMIGEVATVYQGYGLTTVDKEKWDAWVAQNEKETATGGGHRGYGSAFFATVKLSDTKAKVNEMAAEDKPSDHPGPLNPEKRGMGKNVPKDIVKADKTVE